MTVGDKTKRLGVTPRKAETVKIGDTVKCIDFDGYDYEMVVEQVDDIGVNFYEHSGGYEYRAYFYPYCSGHGDELLIIE